MIIKEIIQKLHTTMVDARGQESHFESWLTQNEGICDAIDMLKELAKQEQGEPVDADDFFRMIANRNPSPFPLQQRTWVGLTDEEKADIAAQGHQRWKEYAEAIEAKLKEKNT